jgi:predicted transposase YdaD
VRKVKSSEEIGVKYMQEWEERYYERQEARKEGFDEGRTVERKELIRLKLQKGKSIEAIADALEEDIETIQSLIEEIRREEADR